MPEGAVSIPITTVLGHQPLSPDTVQAFLALKTLGKRPAGALSLARTLSKGDLGASCKAFQCGANALLLIEKARDTFVKKK